MNPNDPAEKDQLNRQSDQDEPLLEKDFIHEGRLWGRFPVWIWIFLVSILVISVYGTYDWFQGYVQDEKSQEPFLEVTNRQFSVFLWQYPAYLRVNSSIKTGYLPGFETNGEGLLLSAVENYVSVPPDLLFLYHTWHRLLSSDYIPRPISPKSFDEFLNQTQEWLPDYWKGAPQEYAKLINSLSYKELPDLQSLSAKELPIVVRQSYQGWKNYFEEGPDINAMAPTFGQVKEFLNKHPNYARNFWRNIGLVANQQVAGLDYLSSFLKPMTDPDAKVPNNQLAPFLKLAMFNAQQAEQGK